jgi:uncharacterized membrane protein
MSDDLSRLEGQIGRVLRGGVLAVAVLFIGGLALLFAGATAPAAYALAAGLVTLIAIPATRVLASFVDALRRRDRLLIFATGTVLLILISQVVYQALKAK